MRPRAGFTLVEVLVGLALALLLAAGLAAILQNQRRIVQRQAQSADLQQSVRILGGELARVVRASGRGGLPAAIALETRNNVGEGSRIGGPATPRVLGASDVLIARGVFEGPLAVMAAVESRGGDRFDLLLRSQGPLGTSQSLDGFVEVVEEASVEALLLAGSHGAGVAIVELIGGSVELDPRGAPGSIVLTVRTSGSERADGYRRLVDSVGAWLDPKETTQVGIVSEYRLYVRLASDPFGGGELSRIARARFYPGTELVHPSAPSAGEDLVDHALDLQVALGFDLDGDGEISEGARAGDRAADEWLMNDAGDDPADETWAESGALLVRVAGWLSSARAQLGYVSAARDRLEDRIYGEPTEPSASGMAERRYLRAEFGRVIRRRNP